MVIQAWLIFNSEPGLKLYKICHNIHEVEMLCASRDFWSKAIVIKVGAA